MVAWRGTAELVCKYFKKGRPMAVTGSLETQRYTDKVGNKAHLLPGAVDSSAFWRAISGTMTPAGAAARTQAQRPLHLAPD